MDLKKLKIFLLIFLISIIFIPKVSASTLLEGKLNLRYNDTTLSYLTQYETKLNNLRNYLQSVNTFTSGGYTFRLDSGNYIVRVQNINTDTLKVWLLDGANTGNYFKSEYTEYNKRIQYYISSFISFNVNFNGNNVVSRDTTSVGNTFFNWSNSYPSECDLYNEICIGNTASYMDTYFYTNTSTVPFNHCTGTNCSEFGLIVNNYTYNPGDNINIKFLFDNLNPNVPIDLNCSLQPLGVVKNVSSFTYEVSGIGNALNIPLKGQFAFVGRGGTPLLTNDYNIQVKEKNNEDIEGRYEFQCNDEDIGNGCMLKYEYNYIDDIDTSLTLQFTFTSMTGQLDYEYSFYSCNVNNSKMNYTYIDNIGGNNQIVENPSLENSINDDNITESDNFLNDNIINNSAFNQDHGLTAIIQAPINFLQSLSSKTCSNIVLPIPHLGNATIPCMSSIYSSKFNELYNILKIIINGVLCYRMALSVVMIVKGAKDPDNDKIEVMDL